MMYADALFPHGFHPADPARLPDYRSIAWPYSRIAAPGAVKYYFTDFGLSLRFQEGASRIALGEHGADKLVPELSDHIPYDPFKVDIFTLGQVLRNKILDVRTPWYRHPCFIGSNPHRDIAVSTSSAL